MLAMELAIIFQIVPDHKRRIVFDTARAQFRHGQLADSYAHSIACRKISIGIHARRSHHARSTVESRRCK